jgi:phosphohistidine phosphatase
VKRLTLVRHADSGWASGLLADRDRPLSTRGQRDAEEMAARLLAAKQAPSRIITSPAVRALATARIFARAFGYPGGRIRHAPDAYLAPDTTLLDVVRRLGGRSRHLMLFGHNPGISHFAALLTGGDPPGELPTCAVVSLLVPLANWGDLQSGHATPDFQYFP